MKKLLAGTKNSSYITMLFILFFFLGNAQSKDSLSRVPKKDKITFKQLLLPATLLTTGTLLVNTSLNKDIQKNANRFFGKNFDTSTDDYLQFIPIGQIYMGQSLGFKSKNNFQHQTVHIALANAIALMAVTALKRTTNVERPDATDHYSFPSGHTTFAFTNAALLYYQYKDSNLWYASSGFLLATATGVLRMANNKHYTSDVLAGAGIGLASGLLVSYWNPFKSMPLYKKKKTTAFVYPQMGRQIGLGTLIQLN